MTWVGDPAVLDQLRRNIESCSPTLLTGPDGVGKMLAARTAAEGLGKVIEVSAAGAGGADRVRALAESLGHRAPTRRIVLLSVAASTDSRVVNRLLKILEESPEIADVAFILSGAGATRMPTIVSRTHKLAVPTIPAALVAAVLLRDDPLIDPEVAWWAGRSCGGAVGAARELVEAREYLLRARSLLRAAVSADRPAWLADLAALSADRIEGAGVVLLLRTWAAEVLTRGGSLLLGDTDGAERNRSLVASVLEATSSRAGRTPSLAVRRGMFSAVYA